MTSTAPVASAQPVASLQSGLPEAPLFRLGRGSDPWAWPDWTYAKPDGTFGNRYDDPESYYRVLYACGQRLGAFVECLARFRPDPAVVAGLATIAGDPQEALMPGEVPHTWLLTRRLGEAVADGEFVDIGHSSSLQWLRLELAGAMVDYGLQDLDGAAIRMSVPRSFTQQVSRRIYDQTLDGRPRYAGITYLSRMGDEFRNWAIFEPTRIASTMFPMNVYDTDLDFRRALDLLGLTLVEK